MVMPQNLLLQCVVVTPERAVLDATVDFVAVPMYDGELGVLPGRAPLIGRLGAGELRAKRGNNVYRFFVDSGFVEIKDNVVTVLTSRAIEEEDLNVEKAQELLAQAKERAATPEEQEMQLRKQAKARIQLRMARKK
jgi:F-type H+-transporting ATPase subunit epsilon